MAEEDVLEGALIGGDNSKLPTSQGGDPPITGGRPETEGKAFDAMAAAPPTQLPDRFGATPDVLQKSITDTQPVAEGEETIEEFRRKERERLESEITEPAPVVEEAVEEAPILPKIVPSQTAFNSVYDFMKKSPTFDLRVSPEEFYAKYSMDENKGKLKDLMYNVGRNQTDDNKLDFDVSTWESVYNNLFVSQAPEPTIEEQKQQVESGQPVDIMSRFAPPVATISSLTQKALDSSQKMMEAAQSVSEGDADIGRDTRIAREVQEAKTPAFEVVNNPLYNKDYVEKNEVFTDLYRNDENDGYRTNEDISKIDYSKFNNDPNEVLNISERIEERHVYDRNYSHEQYRWTIDYKDNIEKALESKNEDSLDNALEGLEGLEKDELGTYSYTDKRGFRISLNTKEEKQQYLENELSRAEAAENHWRTESERRSGVQAIDESIPMPSQIAAESSTYVSDVELAIIDMVGEKAYDATWSPLMSRIDSELDKMLKNEPNNYLELIEEFKSSFNDFNLGGTGNLKSLEEKFGRKYRDKKTVGLSGEDFEDLLEGFADDFYDGRGSLSKEGKMEKTFLDSYFDAKATSKRIDFIQEKEAQRVFSDENYITTFEGYSKYEDYIYNDFLPKYKKKVGSLSSDIAKNMESELKSLIEEFTNDNLAQGKKGFDEINSSYESVYNDFIKNNPVAQQLQDKYQNLINRASGEDEILKLNNQYSAEMQSVEGYSDVASKHQADLDEYQRNIYSENKKSYDSKLQKIYNNATKNFYSSTRDLVSENFNNKLLKGYSPTEYIEDFRSGDFGAGKVSFPSGGTEYKGISGRPVSETIGEDISTLNYAEQKAAVNVLWKNYQLSLIKELSSVEASSPANKEEESLPWYKWTGKRPKTEEELKSRKSEIAARTGGQARAEFMFSALDGVMWNKGDSPFKDESAYAIKTTIEETISDLDVIYNEYTNQIPSGVKFVGAGGTRLKFDEGVTEEQKAVAYEVNRKRNEIAYKKAELASALLRPVNDTGFWSGLGSGMRGNLHKTIPFMSTISHLANGASELTAANKIQEGIPLNTHEVLALNGKAQADALANAMPDTWTNTGYNVGETLDVMLAYIGEYAMTFGSAGLPSMAAQKTATSVAKKTMKKSLEKAIKAETGKSVEFLKSTGLVDDVLRQMGKTEALAAIESFGTTGVSKRAMSALDLLVRSTAQTAMNPQMVFDNTMERMTPEVILAINGNFDDLMVQIQSKGEDFGEAFAKGFGMSWAEMLTEQFGHKIFSPAFKELAKGLGGTDLIKRISLGAWLRTKGYASRGTAMRDIIRKNIGYDGVINEYLEEFVNARLSSLLTGDSGVWDVDGQQELETFLAVAVFGVPFSVKRTAISIAKKGIVGRVISDKKKKEHIIFEVDSPQEQTKAEAKADKLILSELKEETKKLILKQESLDRVTPEESKKEGEYKSVSDKIKSNTDKISEIESKQGKTISIPKAAWKKFNKLLGVDKAREIEQFLDKNDFTDEQKTLLRGIYAEVNGGSLSKSALYQENKKKFEEETKTKVDFKEENTDVVIENENEETDDELSYFVEGLEEVSFGEKTDSGAASSAKEATEGLEEVSFGGRTDSGAAEGETEVTPEEVAEEAEGLLPDNYIIGRESGYEGEEYNVSIETTDKDGTPTDEESEKATFTVAISTRVGEKTKTKPSMGKLAGGTHVRSEKLTQEFDNREDAERYANNWIEADKKIIEKNTTVLVDEEVVAEAEVEKKVEFTEPETKDNKYLLEKLRGKKDGTPKGQWRTASGKIKKFLGKKLKPEQIDEKTNEFRIKMGMEKARNKPDLGRAITSALNKNTAEDVYTALTEVFEKTDEAAVKAKTETRKKIIAENKGEVKMSPAEEAKIKAAEDKKQKADTPKAEETTTKKKEKLVPEGKTNIVERREGENPIHETSVNGKRVFIQKGMYFEGKEWFEVEKRKDMDVWQKTNEEGLGLNKVIALQSLSERKQQEAAAAPKTTTKETSTPAPKAKETSTPAPEAKEETTKEKPAPFSVRNLTREAEDKAAEAAAKEENKKEEKKEEVKKGTWSLTKKVKKAEEKPVTTMTDSKGNKFTIFSEKNSTKFRLETYDKNGGIVKDSGLTMSEAKKKAKEKTERTAPAVPKLKSVAEGRDKIATAGGVIVNPLVAWINKLSASMANGLSALKPSDRVIDQTNLNEEEKNLVVETEKKYVDFWNEKEKADVAMEKQRQSNPLTKGFKAGSAGSSNRIQAKDTSTKAKLISLDEIILKVTKALGIKVSWNTIQRKKDGWYGRFLPKRDRIDLKNKKDLDALAHEVGHKVGSQYKIDESVHESREGNSALEAEIKRLTEDGIEMPEKGSLEQTKEAVAEYIRAWAFNQAAAENQYREMTKIFEESNVSQKHKDALAQFGNNVAVYESAKSVDRAAAERKTPLVVRGQKLKGKALDTFLPVLNPTYYTWSRFDKEGNLITSANIWDSIGTNWISQFYRLEKLVSAYEDKVAKKELLAEENPFMLARMGLGFDNKFADFIQGGGLVDINGRRIIYIDPKTKKAHAVNFDFLVEPINNGNGTRTVEMKDKVAVYMQSQRTIEYVKKLVQLDEEGNPKMKEGMYILNQQGKEVEEKEDEKEAYLDPNKITGLGYKKTDYEDAIENLESLEAEFEENEKNGGNLGESIKEAAARYRFMADQMLQYMVAMGSISQEKYNNIKTENSYYVAMHRIMNRDTDDINESLSKRLGKAAWFSRSKPDVVKAREQYKIDLNKSITGSATTIADPYVNLLGVLQVGYRTAERNNIMVSYVDMLKEMGSKYDLIDFAKNKQYKIGKNEVKVFINGQPKVFVMDAFAKNIIDAVNDSHINAPYILTVLPTTLKKFITSTIPFAIRNVTRDTLNRLIISRSPISLKDYRTTGKMSSEDKNRLKELDNQETLTDEESKEHQALIVKLSSNATDMLKMSGADQTAWYLKDPQSYESLQKHAMKEAIRSKQSTVLNTARKLTVMVPFSKRWNQMMSKSEVANRLVEYKSTYRKKYPELIEQFSKEYAGILSKEEIENKARRNAMIEAGFEARDLMDFAVSGNIARTINQLIPFFNPMIQGLARGQKSLTQGNSKSVVKRILTTTIMGSAIEYSMAMMGGYDDELDKQPSYLKDMFWNFKAAPDFWIRIPKPFEMGLPSSALTRGISFAKGNDKAFEGFGKTLKHTFVPLSITKLQAVGFGGAMVDIMMNYDSFRQKDIIPFYEENLFLSERNPSFSSTFGQYLHALGIADARNVDHLIKNLFGKWGGMALDISDYLPRLEKFKDSDKYERPIFDTDRPLKSVLTALGMTAGTAASASRDVVYVVQQATGYGDTKTRRQIKKLVKGVYEKDISPSEKEAKIKILTDYASRKRMEYEKREEDTGKSYEKTKGGRGGSSKTPFGGGSSENPFN